MHFMTLYIGKSINYFEIDPPKKTPYHTNTVFFSIDDSSFKDFLSKSITIEFSTFDCAILIKARFWPHQIK